MTSAVDLHTHSSASDGVYSPSELVAMAHDKGVEVVALTDHDTVSGLAEALVAAQTAGIRLITGVEISSDDDGVQTHVLGYHVDHTSPVLANALERFAEARMNRARSILERLQSLGITLPWDQLCDTGHCGAIGRPHIARLMMQEGYVASIEEAFGRYLNHGQKAYVPRVKITPAEAIQMVHGAGGLAVLAHPWSVIFMLEPLVDQGLDGIEVFYRDYDACQQGRLGRLAKEHGLLTTGGSDYHGPARQAPGLGEVRVPLECVAELDARRSS